MMTDTLHPFEVSNLGVAPFRFVALVQRVGPIQVQSAHGIVEVGSPGQPMGTCAHCGMGIANCCVIQDADGKQFDVGTTCVNKVYADANAKASDLARDPVYQAIKKAKRIADRKKRHAREAVKLAECKSLLNDSAVRDRLSAQPHPQQWAADKGQTALDNAEWMWRNSGTSGCLRLLKWLKTV